MKKFSAFFMEFFPYVAAMFVFFMLRLPLLPLWWPDFHSDFAMVGIMAQHTKAGNFPIYFYGQNYMGGLEWLTAALLSLVAEKGPAVSLDILRSNSLLWWFAASAAWVVVVRQWSVVASHLVAWLFAFATLPLLQVSVLQELSPQQLFFGALLVYLLGRFADLQGKRGFVFGLVLGLAWWTNQSVVFFFLPAIILFRAIPAAWHRTPLLSRMLKPNPRLRWAYSIVGVLVVIGGIIAVLGGVNFTQGGMRIKIPNGISLARDAVLVLIALQFGRVLLALWKEDRLREAFLPLLPVASGFLLGFAPAWLGRILGLYEKSYGVGLAILPFWHWPAQARSLVSSLYLVVFSAQWILLAAVALVVAVAAAFGGWKKPSVFLRYCIWVALLNCLYVFFSDRSAGVPIRYLYPAFVAMAVGVSVLASRIEPALIRNLCVALLLAVFAWSAIQSRNHLFDRADAMRARKVNLETVASLIQESGNTHCWGDYWSSYLFTYLTEERLIFSPHPDAPHGQVRIKSHAAAVAANKPDCYLFRDDESATAKIFFSGVNPWVKK